MTENPNAFKHWFNPESIGGLAERLAAAGDLDVKAFRDSATRGIDALELKDRVRLIATALREHLDDDFEIAVAHILRALPPRREGTDEVAGGFVLWPYCHFVETYGLEHLSTSLDAMYELTQRFSAEFAVRPFLQRYPDEVLAWLSERLDDPSPHVRRWISEGTRPRLPWGIRLQSFVDDPTPILPLLEALRFDDEEYVRRSVANSLNDIAKDHPELVAELAKRWWRDADDDGRRMIKHALRTLVKNGHRGALAVLGFGPAKVAVTAFTVSPTMISVGDVITMELALCSTAQADQSLLIDYAVHHQRANGTTSPKVFKWTTKKLEANATFELSKRHTMRVVTTRRYYPGKHLVEVLINGQSVGSATFDLLPQ